MPRRKVPDGYDKPLGSTWDGVGPEGYEMSEETCLVCGRHYPRALMVYPRRCRACEQIRSRLRKEGRSADFRKVVAEEMRTLELLNCEHERNHADRPGWTGRRDTRAS